MTTYDSASTTTDSGSTANLTPPEAGTTPAARAAIRRTREQAASTARRHPVPTAATVLAALGATVGAVIWRRRAARATVTRRGWLPAFRKH